MSKMKAAPYSIVFNSDIFTMFGFKMMFSCIPNGDTLYRIGNFTLYAALVSFPIHISCITAKITFSCPETSTNV